MSNEAVNQSTRSKLHEKFTAEAITRKIEYLQNDKNYMSKVAARQLGCFSMEDLAKIALTRVGIFGLGAVGSVLTQMVTRFGFGYGEEPCSITVVDNDAYDESNFARQFGARDESVSIPKATYTKIQLQRLGLGEIDARIVKVTPENAAELIQNVDLALHALDDIKGGAALVAACQKKGILAIEGWGFMFNNALVHHPSGPTWAQVYGVTDIINGKTISDLTVQEERQIISHILGKYARIPQLIELYDPEKVQLLMQGKIAGRTNVFIWGASHQTFTEAINQVLGIGTRAYAPLMKLYDPFTLRSFYYDLQKERKVFMEPTKKKVDWNHVAFHEQTREQYIRDFGFRTVIKEITHLQKGNRVLDVGCGIGAVPYLLHELYGDGIQIRGIDFDHNLVKYGSQHWGHPSNIQLEQGDAHALNYNDDSFDLVTSFGVIEFLSNPILAISEMVRVAKPGGRILTILLDTDRYELRPMHPKAMRFLMELRRGLGAYGIRTGNEAKYLADLFTRSGVQTLRYDYWFERRIPITEEFLKSAGGMMQATAFSPAILEFYSQFLKEVGWTKERFNTELRKALPPVEVVSFFREHLGEDLVDRTPAVILESEPLKKGAE